MPSLPDQRLQEGNTRLAALLQNAQRALRGEATFGVQEVRQLHGFLGEMAPVVAQFSELRRAAPENGGRIDTYKAQLLELSDVLRGVRLMLLAQRTQLENHRAQITAVSRWANTLRQTSTHTLR